MNTIFTHLPNIFNEHTWKGLFSGEWKLADAALNEDPSDKENYTRIKWFVTLIFKTLVKLSYIFFPDLLCEFRQGYSTQHGLIHLMQKCQNV